MARSGFNENSMNIRDIAIGLYRGWGGGGLCAPTRLLIRVCRTSKPLCVSVEFVCLSISLSVYLNLYMYLPACLSVCMSVCLSLSICGVVLADQGSRARHRAFKVFCWDSKSVLFPFYLSWRKPIIFNYASIIRNHYPLL